MTEHRQRGSIARRRYSSLEQSNERKRKHKHKRKHTRTRREPSNRGKFRYRRLIRWQAIIVQPRALGYSGDSPSDSSIDLIIGNP